MFMSNETQREFLVSVYSTLAATLHILNKKENVFPLKPSNTTEPIVYFPCCRL